MEPKRMKPDDDDDDDDDDTQLETYSSSSSSSTQEQSNQSVEFPISETKSKKPRISPESNQQEIANVGGSTSFEFEGAFEFKAGNPARGVSESGAIFRRIAVLPEDTISDPQPPAISDDDVNSIEETKQELCWKKNKRGNDTESETSSSEVKSNQGSTDDTEESQETVEEPTSKKARISSSESINPQDGTALAEKFSSALKLQTEPNSSMAAWPTILPQDDPLFTNNSDYMMEDLTDDQFEESMALFRVFDRDRTDFIPAARLRNFMKSILGDKLTDEELDEIIHEADVNGDGRIYFEGFMKTLTGKPPV